MGQEAEEKEVETVKIENEQQVALVAPPSSRTYKNSINGSSKITRFVFEVIIHFPDTNFSQVCIFKGIEARNKPATNFHGACLSQD